MTHQIVTNYFRSIILLLTTLLIITTFSSCEKNEMTDDPDTTPTDIVITHNPDLYTGSISGQVLNENLEPLEGVKINVRGEEITTDVNGYFNFQEIQLDAQGTIVTASKENYWSITKMVVPSKTQQNQTRIMLLPKATGSMIASTSGGVVNFNDAIKIDFPTNAFVKENGDAYDGEVEVSAIHLNPNDENFGMRSPGDFRAFNAESELQTLLSLGMAGVELTGSNNEILALKSDVNATLSIKVPEGTTVQEVPLWHFDEDSGYWLEEGTATRQGDFYVGEVSHFSWWNCDVPFPTIKLSGSVINENGGIAGLPVSIILAEDMWNQGAEYTGDEGLFCGWVPQDVELIIQIRNECGNIFYEEAIGPFSEDTELPPITSPSQNVVEVCGTLADCDGNIVTNGYLVVQHQSSTNYIPVDPYGNFCSTVDICNSTSFEIYGIDITEGLQGLPSTHALADSPITDFELTACDEIVVFFRFQIGNEEEVIVEDFTINSANDGVVTFGGNSELNGVFPGAIVDGTNWDGNFQLGYYNVSIASPTSEVVCDFGCQSTNVQVIEYNGVGSQIILKIIGVSNDGQAYTIDISGILEG